jgi:Tfp pilus assembly protein PilN
LKEEFAPRLDVRRWLRPLRSTAVLAAIALVLGLASGVWQIALQSRRATELEAQLGAMWSEVQPGKPVPADVAKSLDQALRASRQRAELLGIYGGAFSALDVLTEISKLVPKDLAVIFEELSIDGQVVRLRGHTPSYAAVDQMKTALAAFPHFGEIRVSEIQSDAQRGGNTFSVTIGLAEPDDGDAPPPPGTRRPRGPRP